MTRSRLRRSAPAAVLLVAVLGAGACANNRTEGQAVGPDVGKVGGVEVTSFPSGLKPDAPQPQIQVENASDSQEDKVAVATIADVTDYWTQVMPKDFGMEFQQLKRLLSYDSNTDDFQLCRESIKGLINAFYCPLDDAIAWDRGELLPRLTTLYGDVASITVLAHEYGHAVQHRLGAKAGIRPGQPEPKTIVLEQQADCFTGGYFRWIVDGNSKYFRVSTAEGLNAALSTMYLVRDAPGKTHVERGAHGTSFDRTLAFQEGFEQGPKTCAAYNEELIKARTSQIPFKEDNRNQEVDVAIDEQHLNLVKQNLDAVFPGKGQPSVVTGSGSCADGGGTPPASYCPENNTITVDLPTLAQIGSPLEHELETGQASKGKGDFAAWGSIASRYALAVQKANGEPIDDAMAAMRTACLTGHWAKAAQNPAGTDGPQIELAPGDVDEAILEMLQPKSLIGSNVTGGQVPSGFLRVEAFRKGFLQGAATCSSTYR